jgi:hypothetical protein
MGDALHFDSPQEGVPEDESGMRHLKIDVYAFGVTLWEMLMRQRPHGDLHAFQIQVRSPATAHHHGLSTASACGHAGQPAAMRAVGTEDLLAAFCSPHLASAVPIFMSRCRAWCC